MARPQQGVVPVISNTLHPGGTLLSIAERGPLPVRHRPRYERTGAQSLNYAIHTNLSKWAGLFRMSSNTMTSTALALETRLFAPAPLHRRSRRVRVRQVMAARGASSPSHDNGSHDPGSWTPPARAKKSVSTNADSLAAGKKNINLGSGGLAPPRAVAIGRPSDQQDQLPLEPANADSRSVLRE